MGSKYKKKFEREWYGRTLGDIKAKTIQQQADVNLSDIVKGKYKRKRRYK